MGQLKRMRVANNRADDWLRSHPVFMYGLFLVVPLLTIVGLTILNGDPVTPRVVINGLIFGVTFAVVSYYFNTHYRA